ncbi:hypothetical protein DFH27DRAFT_46173 [Peziza echinospora]|nr:hypothetical protein DFH27DRAFT_46173 [Peziza echinospora]
MATFFANRNHKFLLLLVSNLLLLTANASPTTSPLTRRDQITTIPQDTTIYLDEAYLLEWEPLLKLVDIYLYEADISGSKNLVTAQPNTGKYAWTPKGLTVKGGYSLGVRSYDATKTKDTEKNNENTVGPFSIGASRGGGSGGNGTTGGTGGGDNRGSDNDGTNNLGGNVGENGSGAGGEKKSSGTIVGAAIGASIGGILILLATLLFYGHRKRGWFSSSGTSSSSSTTSASPPPHSSTIYAEADGTGIEFIKPPPAPQKQNLGHRMSKRLGFGRHELSAKSAGPEKAGHGRHELDVVDCEVDVPVVVAAVGVAQQEEGGQGDDVYEIEEAKRDVYELPVMPGELGVSHAKDLV